MIVAPELPRPPWIVAHRGDSRHAPENSREALRRAAAARADMVEVDVQLTADEVLRLFHDRDARRLTGHAGSLEKMDVADVRSLRLRGNGEPLPTLAEAFAELPPSMSWNVEIKRWTASRPRVVSAILEALASRPGVLVSSFDWELLRRLRAQAPTLALAPLADRDAADLLDEAEDLAAWSVHVHRRLVDEALLESARRAGRPLLVFTVDDPAEAGSLFARGVSGVFTNDPGGLRRALAGAPAPGRG